MIRVGLVAALLGFLSPIIAFQVGFPLYWMLFPCTAIALVTCVFALARGAF